MLLSTIHAFLAFFYVDALPVAAVVAAIAFTWMWYFIGSAHVAAYWIAWSPGLAVAVVARWHNRQLGAIGLWPNSTTTPRQMLAALLLVFSFTWYPLNIEDPATSLFEPFPIGAVQSLLIATPVLFILEIVDHVASSATRRSFQTYSTHLHTWVALLCIVAVDLVAWGHAWLLVIVAGSALIAMAVVARVALRMLC